MGGFTQLIDLFARLTGWSLPPWGAPLGILALLVLFSPWILANVRSANTRKLLTHAARESGTRREELEKEAFTLASRTPDSLLAFAIEAHQQGRRALTERALAALEAQNAHHFEVARLRRELRGPSPTTALDAILLIERLVSSGVYPEARRRWTEARQRWPNDPEIAALESTLDGPPTDP